MTKQDKKELRQQIVCEWLEQNYLNYGSLRHDVVTDRLQIRVADLHSLSAPHNATSVIGDPAEDASLQNAPKGLQFRGKENWRNLTDKDINTMVCDCVEETQVNISVNEMWTALKSDRVPTVHPIRAWLNSLPPYTSDQPDWIDWLAQQVHVHNSPQSGRPIGGTPSHSEASHSPYGASSGSNADALWRKCFKKWFVAMVASWMKDEVVNHTVLVLIGRQGIFKTTWLEHLIPPALRPYSSKMPLSGQITKDDRLRLCENAMLNIDELDAICGREMNIVKSLLTSTDVNERAAYGRLKERRMRLASFCASTNNREFLTDITGNRRWLPFEVESIQNPFHTQLPYEHIYAQAKALVEGGMFMYWFDLEDIEQLEKHNEHFRALENEEQLLPLLFDKPADGKGEFMTTAEISDRLATYGGIKKPMSIRKLNTILERYEFKAARPYVDGKQVRGWLVYKRKQDEIESKQKELANKSQRHEDTLY